MSKSNTMLKALPLGKSYRITNQEDFQFFILDPEDRKNSKTRMKIRSKMQYHITMDYHNSCEMTLYNTR